MEKIYVSPSVEVIEVEVEEGFAASAVVSTKGTVNNYTTNNFGSTGGRTMVDF